MDSKLKKNKAQFSEMLALIPKMQEAVRTGLLKHYMGLEQGDHEQIQEKLQELRKGIEILDPKYSFDIIFVLSQENTILFFNELKKLIPYINSTTLSDRLKKLEKNGIIDRKIYPNERPIRVSYNLTEMGHGIFRLLLPLLVYVTYYKKNL